MLQQYVNAKAPLRLQGLVQRYAWGKVGAASRIAPFLPASEATGPLAEIWLGAHPKGSAGVLLAEREWKPLSLLLPRHADLPFMLKVLSINPEYGLSIQSHPDAQTAQVLHAKDPAHYPDPSHKPELGIALSTVTLLHGFKSFSAIVSVVQQLPELKSLIGEERVRRIEQIGNEHDPQLLKDTFRSLIEAKAGDVSRFVSSVLNRIGSHTDVPRELEIIRRLTQRHGTEDVGLAALCVMNVIQLFPGEAIFIGPNIPHAYLDGDLVECMACSDNVIRAGLTSKYKDTSTLVETIDYSRAQPTCVVPEITSEGTKLFSGLAGEFSVGIVDRTSRRGFVDTAAGVAIVLCLGRAARVQHAVSGSAVELTDGGAVLLLKGSGSYELSAVDSDLFFALGA